MIMLRAMMLSFLSILFLTSDHAFAQKKRKPNPVFAPVKDDPKLPRVLLIGDSISIGYTLPVREMLKGKANVHRIPTNGGPTIRGLASIDKWIGKKKWDVIHFNWGLHDLKMDNSGTHQVPLQKYKQHLSALVLRLKKTGAKLIWASTTPVPQGKVRPPRKDSDVIAYNEAAEDIMELHNVAIDDLYTFAKARLKEIQRPLNVHFTKSGSRELAKAVSASIEKALKR